MNHRDYSRNFVFKHFYANGVWAGRGDVRVSLMKRPFVLNHEDTDLGPYRSAMLVSAPMINLTQAGKYRSCDADDVLFANLDMDEVVVGILIHDDKVPIAFFGDLPVFPMFTANGPINIVWSNGVWKIFALGEKKS